MGFQHSPIKTRALYVCECVCLSLGVPGPGRKGWVIVSVFAGEELGPREAGLVCPGSAPHQPLYVLAPFPGLSACPCSRWPTGSVTVLYPTKHAEEHSDRRSRRQVGASGSGGTSYFRGLRAGKDQGDRQGDAWSRAGPGNPQQSVALPISLQLPQFSLLL